MKKKLLYVPILILLLTGCTTKDQYITPESISIVNIHQTTELVIGDVLQLYTSILPQEADQNVVWSTNNSAVATVTSGKIQALSAGDVVVSAVSAKLNTVTADLTFRVLDPQTQLMSISLTAPEDDTTLYEGSTLALTASINPVTASYDSLRWLSLDTSIATVSPLGVVLGVTSGETSIVVEALDKDNTILASHSITVNVIENDWVVNTISKIYDARTLVNTTINVVGKIMVSNATGVIIADNEDAVLVYQPSYEGTAAVVGDIVNLTGSISIFNASAQIIAATIRVINTNPPNITGPSLITNYSEVKLTTYMTGVSQDDIVGRQKLLVKPLYVEVHDLTAVLAGNGYIDLYLEDGSVNFSIKGSSFRNDLKAGDKVNFRGYITGIEQALDHSFPRVAIYAVEGSQVITKV